jgi:hypothetical protein
MTSFIQKAVELAEQYGQKAGSIIPKETTPVTTPIAVAGLADTVKSAIAGMARAQTAAKALNDRAGRLVSNIAAVESLGSQLDAANAELEAAVAQVGAPLEGSLSGNAAQAGAGGNAQQGQPARPHPEAMVHPGHVPAGAPQTVAAQQVAQANK